MQNILQDDLKRLANLLEFALQDNKPPRDFWDTLDKEAFVRELLDKHVGSAGGGRGYDDRRLNCRRRRG